MDKIPEASVKVSLDSKDLDDVIKKIEKLNELLKETRQLLPEGMELVFKQVL